MNSVLKSRQETSVNTGQTEEGAEVWRKGGSWANVTAPGAVGSLRPLGVPWRGLCPHTHLANPAQNPANPGQSFCSFPRSRSHGTETGVVSDLAVQPQLRNSVSFLSFLYPFLHNRFFSDWCFTSWNLSPHLPHSEGPPASPAAPPTPSSLLITLEAGGGGGPTCRSRIPASLPWCPAPGSSA